MAAHDTLSLQCDSVQGRSDSRSHHLFSFDRTVVYMILFGVWIFRFCVPCLDTVITRINGLQPHVKVRRESFDAGG